MVLSWCNRTGFDDSVISTWSLAAVPLLLIVSFPIKLNETLGCCISRSFSNISLMSIGLLGESGAGLIIWGVGDLSISYSPMNHMSSLSSLTWSPALSSFEYSSIAYSLFDSWLLLPISSSEILPGWSWSLTRSCGLVGVPALPSMSALVTVAVLLVLVPVMGSNGNALSTKVVTGGSHLSWIFWEHENSLQLISTNIYIKLYKN